MSAVTPKRVTISNDVVAKINANRPQQSVQRRDTAVGVTDRPTTVIAGAGMGVQGRPGAPGGSIPALAFAFGDAAHTVWSPTFPGTWNYARLIIDVPFNAPAVIHVGTSSQPDIGVPTSDPTAAQEFENTPDVHLAAGVGVVLSIEPNGATQGSGRLLLEFLPD